MSLTTTGIIGIIILVLLLYSKMPVGYAMGFLGLMGFSYVVNFEAGCNLLVRDIWDVFSSYSLTVIRLCIVWPPPGGTCHGNRGCVCRVFGHMRLDQRYGGNHGNRYPSRNETVRI